MRQVLILMQILAFWPSWRWCSERLGSSPAEAAQSALAVGTALLLWLRQRSQAISKDPRLLLPTALTLLYAANYPVLPPILRCAVAISAVAATLSTLRTEDPFHPGIRGLLLLALPVIPSLEFFLGFPLRTVAAEGAVLLLRLSGVDVARTGLSLHGEGIEVWVDAPCGGIRMLWTGLFLALACSSLHQLLLPGMIRLLLATVGIVLTANTFRAAALFLSHGSLIRMPGWGHEGAGVVCFVVGVTGILWVSRRLGRAVCAPSS